MSSYRIRIFLYSRFSLQSMMCLFLCGSTDESNIGRWFKFERSVRCDKITFEHFVVVYVYMHESNFPYVCNTVLLPNNVFHYKTMRFPSLWRIYQTHNLPCSPFSEGKPNRSSSLLAHFSVRIVPPPHYNITFSEIARNLKHFLKTNYFLNQNRFLTSSICMELR